MWLVHHVPAADQHAVFGRVPVPLLPESKRECDPQQELCGLYEDMRSCTDCHSGTGIPAQDYSDLDGIIPEDPKYPGRARQRRCDQNYQPPCGPCDGVGGPYWGDGLKDFQPTNCEVVSEPDQVPEAERMPPMFPEQFVVHQLGSDRLVRMQNAGGNSLAFYSQIR